MMNDMVWRVVESHETIAEIVDSTWFLGSIGLVVWVNYENADHILSE